MRVLALDTTTRAGSVAIVMNDDLVVERNGDPTRTHAERLPGEIVEAAASVQCTTGDIDLFAVASGPGSFTGLRIGIATIQGLAFVHGRRVAPISALHALGVVAATGRAAGIRVGAWMDAHRREVFAALYEVAVGGDQAIASLVEVEGPTVGPAAATWDRWRRLGPPAAMCGDGALTYGVTLPGSVAVVPTPPLAATIARIALRVHAAGQTVAPWGVQPLYVRRPDAELAREAARVHR